jgi:hypothetical protein
MDTTVALTTLLAANPRAAHRIAAGQLAARVTAIAAAQAAGPVVDFDQWPDPLALLGRPSRAPLSVTQSAA